MPSQREIEEFCEKVESGEMYLEYEVVEAVDSEDFEDDSSFTVADADEEAMLSEITYSREKYRFEKKLKRKQEIALDIRLKCIEPVHKKPQQKISILASSWEQIKELLEQLSVDRKSVV